MFSGFATRFIARTMALGLVVSVLAGCAEIDRRGGVVAEIEDFVLFKADTKSHRLFRSYLLIGVLLAASRQAGHNEIDRQGIEANLKSALEVSFEAYYCLYPPEPAVTQVAAVSDVPRAVSYVAPAAC